MKNIVICSDGTGNTAIKGRGTNVFKIFEAVDQNGHKHHPERIPQIAFYDDGVGTQSLKVLKLLGGATGLGLSRNVRRLYRALCRIYDPGDRLYFFGFSRGAFTVRSLVGLIGACGIVDVRRASRVERLERLVDRAYRAYRHCYDPAWLAWLKRRLGAGQDSPAASFRSEHAHDSRPDIEFVGVWDTVDAVGLPFRAADVINATVYRFKFPDRTLSPLVKCARHALALDDERHSFHPLLWREDGDPRIEQVWFAGAHSNVGGGYPKQGLSLVALDWMMAEAGKRGLRFHRDDATQFAHHASVDDKLYDPRSGAGWFYRWLPRDAAALCRAQGVRARVHLSVLERIAHGTEDYSPGNLEPGAEVAFTGKGDHGQDRVLEARAQAAQRALEAVMRHAHPRPVAPGVDLARYAHSASLLLPPAAGLLALFVHLSTAVALGTTALVLLLLALGPQLRRRRREAFARFWFEAQQELRTVFKQARAQARSAQVPRAS